MLARLGALALAVLVLPGALRAEEKRKLNVLFIVVDDLNDRLACYGHTQVKTPNIDRLAAKGVRFERTYCQYPLCNPSRTSFLSGRLPDVTKIIDNNTPPRDTLGKDAVFLPEYFAKHGYFTARVGKVAHGAYESAVKWDVSENSKASLKEKKQEQALEIALQEGGGVKLSWKMTNHKDEEEPDGNTARRISELIEKNKDKPFFIASGFHKPHLPWIAPKKYFDLYPPAKIELPKEPADVRKNVPPLAFTKTAGDEKMTDDEKKQAIAAYYACVSFTDANVGVLMDTMDRLKLWDTTVVVFFSDHGWHLADHGGLWRKMTLFEQATRVPMIVVAPGVKPGVSPRLTELLDLYPTLTDLAGLPAPEGVQGTSFKPLLEQPNREWSKVVAYTVVGRNKKGDPVLGRSVRNERWRYTQWHNENECELYDHAADPSEYVNLATEPKHAETLATMRKLLKTRWVGTEAEAPEKEAASAKLEGVVTIDGKPLVGAKVSFHPSDEKGKVLTALTDDNGKYRLSVGKKDNAVPGTFRVTIEKKIDGRETLPPGYSDKDKSALMTVIQKGGNVFDLVLSSR